LAAGVARTEIFVNRTSAFPIHFASNSMHVYEVRPRKDHRGIDLISDVLPFDFLPENFTTAALTQ
jgi:hypothetical protein